MFKDGTNIERDSKKITKINMKFSLIFFKVKSNWIFVTLLRLFLCKTNEQINI